MVTRALMVFAILAIGVFIGAKNPGLLGKVGLA